MKDRQQQQQEQVPGYIINRDMPQFTPATEIRRLRRVIAEKDELIKKFKAYDQQRKAYYAAFEEDYKAMKDSFDEFNAALTAICNDGYVEKSDLKRLKKLFSLWLGFKHDAAAAKVAMNQALQQCTPLDGDIVRLRKMLASLPRFSDIEDFSATIAQVQGHVDALRGTLSKTLQNG